MILPNGYSDIPAGKVAAIVTHLEMTVRPASRPDPAGAWTLRRVETPPLDWFRDLYRRVGEEWLWFSRIRMPDAELSAIIHSPLVEVYALEHEGRDEGLLELDLRDAGQCEIAFFGITAKLIGSRRRALADEPCAGPFMVAAGHARLAAHLHLRSSGRAGVLSALGISSVSSGGGGRRRSTARRDRAARCGAACAGD
jgi:hypothetical protein